MIEHVHESEMVVHDSNFFVIDLTVKFRVMIMIEKLLKFWEELTLSRKRQKGEITWTGMILDLSVHE